MKYEGGLGGRESSDLVRWTLEVDDGFASVDTFDGQRGYFRERPPTAELTLHNITKAESEAVVRVINEMRSASQGVVLEPLKYPSIGDRFSGLDL